MKIYGSDICKDCRAFKLEMLLRGVEIDMRDITADTATLKEFLVLRDTNAAFDEVRREGRIGIPCFVCDDGVVTLDADEALSRIGQPPMPARDEADGCAFCG